MSSASALKHEQVALRLAKEIRSGKLSDGMRLPSEFDLARRFGVSRGTMRSALATLSDEGLVATRMGKGSFVTFDGAPLDVRLGWAQALRNRGVDSHVQVVKNALERNGELASALGLTNPEFVVVERVRRLDSQAQAISFESSYVQATGTLKDLPEKGLPAGSLTAALVEAGLVTDHGRQRLRARPLSSEEAQLLGRADGSYFIETTRTSWTEDDTFVEHVVSLLDPEHFELELDIHD